MKSKIKEKWVAALRSGKYKQGGGQLKTLSGTYCCLGVLCDLHSKSLKKKGFKFSKNGQYLGDAHVLSRTVMNWAGLVDDCGDLKKETNGKKTKLYNQVSLNLLNK